MAETLKLETIVKESSDLRDMLNKWAVKTGLSQRAVAEKLGISVTALNQWLKGKYPSDSKGIEDRIRGLLGLKQITGDWEIVETEIMRKVHNLCNYCMEKKIIGLVVGRSGTGKTESLRSYMRENGGLYLEVQPGMTVRAYLEEMIRSCGDRATTRQVYELMEEAVNSIQKRGIEILLVDQANYLQIKGLQITLAIAEKAQIGMVLAGTKLLEKRLLDRSRWYDDLEQISGRIGAIVRTDFAENEMEELLKKLGVEEGARRLFIAYSQRNMRKLCWLVKLAKTTAERNGAVVNVKIAKKSLEFMLGAKIN